MSAEYAVLLSSQEMDSRLPGMRTDRVMRWHVAPALRRFCGACLFSSVFARYLFEICELQVGPQLTAPAHAKLERQMSFLVCCLSDDPEFIRATRDALAEQFSIRDRIAAYRRAL